MENYRFFHLKWAWKDCFADLAKSPPGSVPSQHLLSRLLKSQTRGGQTWPGEGAHISSSTSSAPGVGCEAEPMASIATCGALNFVICPSHLFCANDFCVPLPVV